MVDVKLMELNNKNMLPNSRYYNCKRCKKPYLSYMKKAGNCDGVNCYELYLERKRLSE